MSDAPLVIVVEQIRKLAGPKPPEGETDRDLLRRFVGTQDRQAFEAFVRRHGPLVLGVCRRVLRQEQDAEDAFQATFLALARKAASISDAGAIVSWLYGVANRIARSAKRAAMRRSAREAQARAVPPPDPSWEAAWHEVQAVLHEEIARLPDRLRATFLLCYLEGLGRAEAARQLGLPEGTVWSRLAQARKLLRSRLARRGISLPAVLCAAGVTGSTEAALPAALVISTAKAAAALARGSVAEISPKVLALADPVVRTMALFWCKLGLSLALAASLLVGGVAVLTRPIPVPDGQTASLEMEVGNHTATDCYGDPLPPGALVRMGTTRLRHKNGGTCVAFTADGRQLVTAADDDIVRFWDLVGGKERLVIRAAQHRVFALALSSDGKALATADGEAVRLWNTKNGRELRKIASARDLHFTGPRVFSSDSATLAAAAKDGSILLYHAATGKEGLTLPPQAPGVRCLAFTGDAKNLVSVAENGAALCIWDVSSGHLMRKVPIESPKDIRIRPLALAPDGRTLAVECITQERVKIATGWQVFCQYRLCLRNVADGSERLRTEGEREVLWAAAFSADCKSVVTAGMGDHVRVWDTTTGQLRVALENSPGGSRPDATSTVAFSPEGKKVAAVGDGASARVWDLTQGGPVPGLPDGHQSAVGALAYVASGKTLASASDDGTIRLWDASTGRPQRLLKGHTVAVRALAVAPDGRTLASADREGIIRLWDPVTGKELRIITTMPRIAGVYFGTCPLAFSPDGKVLTCWCDDRRFRRWKVSKGSEIPGRPLVLSGVPAMPEGRLEKQPPEEGRVVNARLSPDGKTGAVLVGGALYLVDVVTNSELFRLQGHSAVGHLAFSLDGRTLASGGWDKKVCLWDVTTGQELLRIDSLDFVNAVAIAPDNRSVAVATGFDNAEVSLLDARSGAVLLRLTGHRSYADALAFAADGKTLALGQRDTSVLVWDLAPGLRRLGSPTRELSQKELQVQWTQLASPDARKARVAVETLATAPAAALPLLKDRLRPAEHAKPEHIQRLVINLNRDEYGVREAATKELAALGAEAESALRSALRGNPTAEVKRRVDALLEGQSPRAVPSGEPLRRLRAIQVLEQIGSPEAIGILQELAGGAPSAPETRDAKAACERLTRRVSGP